MNIHFKLRKQGKADPTITLQVFDSRFKGRKFMYSVGQALTPSLWDKRKERVKSLPGREFELQNLNKHLDELEQAVREFLSTKHNSSSLNREDLKAYLQKLKSDDRKEREEQVQKENDFFSVWGEIIDTARTPKGDRITKSTQQAKLQTLSFVSSYAIDKKFNPTLEGIDKNFYSSFIQYLELRGLSPNTIGKHVKELKAFLREADDRGFNVNQAYLKKSFRVVREDIDSTYLNEDELKKLLQLELNPTYERHRDIFVMACFVGARHSDWHQIRPENVEVIDGKEILRIKQQKTGDSIHVPVHPVVRLIWNKYGGKAPKIIARNKLAESIREVAKKAKLGTVVLNGETVEKWTTISTHTARRSFATNAYLSRALTTYEIMRCTGHKTEVSFLKYLKLNGKDYALQASESKFFSPESWMTISKAG